jgi:hypothetical protein
MKILDKIRALKAKAESTTSEAEAMAFLAKVNEMLIKYDIDASKLEIEEQSEITMIRWTVKYDDPWRREIYVALCRLYHCTPVRHAHWDENYIYRIIDYTVTGREHNCFLVEEMFEYLINTVIRLSRNYSKLRREQLAFQRGCGSSISSKILGMVDDNQAHIKGTGLPIVLQKDKAAIDEFIKKEFRNIRNTTIKRNVGGVHGEAGWQAGKDVNLNTQIKNPQAKGFMLK